MRHYATLAQHYHASVLLRDGVARVIDPTNTHADRTRGRKHLEGVMVALKRAVKSAVVSQDAFGASSANLSPTGWTFSVMSQAFDQSAVFHSMFRTMVDSTLMARAPALIKSIVTNGYNAGLRHGRSYFPDAHVDPLQMRESMSLVQSAVDQEMRGIAEALVQQCARTARAMLATKSGSMPLYHSVTRVIDTITTTRLRAMVSQTVVHAHAMASLDVFSAAGLTQVGITPEALAVHTLGDARAKIKPSKKRKRARPNTGGPGSRTRNPSASTLRRLRAVQARLERNERVNVLTAGDDNVCQVCEDIAEDGPYTINRARQLIPAHPHCRCVFVPVDSARDAEIIVVDAFNPNQPREPKGTDTGGQWVSAGPSTRSVQELKAFKSQHELIMEELDDATRFEEGDTDAMTREYNAYFIMNTIIENDLRARNKPEIATHSYFEYKTSDRGVDDDMLAAIQYEILGDTAEIKWLGSISKGEGTRLLEKATRHAKSLGAKEIVIGAKWGSEAYYKRFGYENAGRFDPLAEIQPMKRMLDFDPNQPREPKGTDKGGQWAAGAGKTRFGSIANDLSKSGNAKQNVETLDELYDKSKAQEAAFKAEIEALARDTMGRAVFTPPEFAEPGTILKSRSSAERKMITEEGGDPRELRDILRGTVVHNSVIETRQAAVRFIKEQGDRIVKVKDRFFHDAGGYRDILINYRSGDVIAEVQFNSRTLIATKYGEGHQIYEKLRSASGSHNEQYRLALAARQRVVYTNAYNRDGNGNWKRT